MGFHDYPPKLDTANLLQSPVYRWRIVMETRQAKGTACRTGQKPNELPNTAVGSNRRCPLTVEGKVT